MGPSPAVSGGVNFKNHHMLVHFDNSCIHRYTPRRSSMGRPTASEANKYVAVAFARLMIEQTGKAEDVVARCGFCSVFALLKCSYPIVVRDGTVVPRDGVSEAEFNKLLQVS